MKPIHLNLASRPYRDYRPVYAAVVLMSLLTAFLMLNNIDTYYRYLHETRTTRAKIAQREAQAAQERQRETAAKQRLATIDLAQLDDQTRFINMKLAERAFSWSLLLDDLESVLANNVRLISVAPSFSKEESGAIDLKLNFEAKESDGMIETINRMHAHPKFARPFPANETQQDGRFTFDLSVAYFPTGSKPAAQATPVKAVIR